MSVEWRVGMALLVDLPDRIDLLLARGLGLANKHVPCLLCAAGDLQELVKLQHPSLAARPPFATPRGTLGGLGGVCISPHPAQSIQYK